MRLKLLVFLLPFVVNVNAVLLTKYSNVDAQRDITAIFSERRAIKTKHGMSKPSPQQIMIRNLDSRNRSMEFSEKRPIEYNVFPAAEPVASDIPSDAHLVDKSAPVPKLLEVDDPLRPQNDSAPIESTNIPEPNPKLQSQPSRAFTYQGDHNQLLSYKYPIYFRNPNLKDYVCADEYNYYRVINQCDHFIECKKREAMEFICPDGLYFNPEAKWQEYPCADPATVVCKIETTTTPSLPINVPQPLPHYKCPDENNYYAIEDQCKSFIECKHFSAMKFSCPYNLLFDPEVKWPKYPCNDASEVRCGPQPTLRPTPLPPRPTPPPIPITDRFPHTTPPTPYVPPSTSNTVKPTPFLPTPAIGPNPPIPTKLIPTTPEPETTKWVDPKRDYTCNEENKYYPLPNDCNSFVECKKFVPMKYECPYGLQFHPQTIWPQYPCAVASEVQCRIPVKPTPPVVPEVVPEIVPNYVCAEENKYYSVNHDCESYIECKKYVAYGWKCSNGLHFNIHARYPDYPCASPSVAKCGKQKLDPVHGCPRSDGYFGLQDGDCSRYLMCEKGRSQIMHCPDGLVFNDKLSSCDWPENVPSCNPAVFQGFSCPVPELDEHGQQDDKIIKYRYGTRCKEYIACQRGYPRLLSCDAGLSFDNESKACIDSKHVTNCE